MRRAHRMRHTNISEIHAPGVPKAQINLASGHADEGANKHNYRHPRPECLHDLINGIESYFPRMDKHATAHLRYQRDTKIRQLPKARKK